jgi:hypothetical protein
MAEDRTVQGGSGREPGVTKGRLTRRLPDCLRAPAASPRGQRSGGPSPPHLAGGAVPGSCVRSVRRPAQPPSGPTPPPGAGPSAVTLGMGVGGVGGAALKGPVSGWASGSGWEWRGRSRPSKSSEPLDVGGGERCKGPGLRAELGFCLLAKACACPHFWVHACGRTRSPAPPGTPGCLPPRLSPPLPSSPSVSDPGRKPIFACLAQPVPSCHQLPFLSCS